ncbi:hypothetical protein DL96DRAFT_1720784 [Flagelloscypha sp. PMI_526]|nr:hypothetical protein DL96DRAFT_1720784 [Flagelloscypha sp. PMI_526]
MSRPPSYTSSADPRDLPQPLAPKFGRYFFSIYTVVSFIVALETAVLGTRWQPSIPSWLPHLKDLARMVSDDLAAVTYLIGTSSGHGLAILRRFWSSVLAIVDEYQKQGRVLEALVAMLRTVHSTTKTLRLLSPVEDDLPKVRKLSQTIIRLLSCILPKPFLVVGHLSPDPNKLIHLPEVQENMQILTEQVDVLHRSARTRQALAMGCPCAGW